MGYYRYLKRFPFGARFLNGHLGHFEKLRNLRPFEVFGPVRLMRPCGLFGQGPPPRPPRIGENVMEELPTALPPSPNNPIFAMIFIALAVYFYATREKSSMTDYEDHT